jgi:two-component system invasion response regulator UvrY
MNILIADDHSIVRRGLIELIMDEFPAAKITEAVNGSEVIAQIRLQEWDLILMDISMPRINGVEALKQIRSEKIKTPILMLSMHSEDQYAIRVLKAGASGFLNKDSAIEELIVAIKRLLLGKKYISESVADRLADMSNFKLNNNSLHEQLSDREMQIFILLAKGCQVSEIGDQLSLSVNTISTYRARVLEKLQLKNNAEIARYAIENELA